MRPRQQRRMDNRREMATGGQIQAPPRQPMQQRPAPVQMPGGQMATPTAGPDQGMRMPQQPNPMQIAAMQSGRMPISKPGTEMGQNVYRPQVMPGQFGGTSWSSMDQLRQSHPMADKFNQQVSQNDPAFGQNPQAQQQMMQYRQRLMGRQGQPRGLMAQPPKPVIPNSDGGY